MSIEDSLKKYRAMERRTTGKFSWFYPVTGDMGRDKFDLPEEAVADQWFWKHGLDAVLVQGWPQCKVVAAWYGGNVKE